MPLASRYRRLISVNPSDFFLHTALLDTAMNISYVHVYGTRLLQREGYRRFKVENLKKYEKRISQKLIQIVTDSFVTVSGA